MEEVRQSYVYAHYRLDSMQVFYIGVSHTGEKYSRAHSKNSRSSHWKNIVNKHGYEVRILFEDLSEQEAYEREIALIKFFGRNDLCQGYLVNMTDGGDGTLGLICSEENREKFSKKILKFSKDGTFIKEYNSIMDAKRDGFNRGNIYACCSNKQKSYKGFVWRYKGDSFDKYEVSKKTTAKGILCFDKNNVLIKKYKSIREATSEGFDRSCIIDCCKERKQLYRGFIWKYSTNND